MLLWRVQAWLCLVTLLVEPACRCRYEMDDCRRSRLLQLQGRLHELLLDQLPVLRTLGRVLDELALGMQAPHGGGGALEHKHGRLILEQAGSSSSSSSSSSRGCSRHAHH